MRLRKLILPIIVLYFVFSGTAFAFENIRFNAEALPTNGHFNFSNTGEVAYPLGDVTDSCFDIEYGIKAFNIYKGIYPDTSQSTGGGTGWHDWSVFSDLNMENFQAGDGNYWIFFQIGYEDNGDCIAPLSVDTLYSTFSRSGGLWFSTLELPPCIVDCFSNVLFLPGMKGSVLETGSDQLWPPTIFSDDVPQLALTSDGTSVNDIHTNGILNEFGPTDIYAPFSNFMDGLVSEELINDWLPLAYDWRFSPETILEEGIKTASETFDVIEKIEELAGQSRTGEVTIVAHSMGGMLGKAIIKKLEEEGKDNLIDSFVMVGTPQLGTPQALATILHGDNESILAGFIVNPTDIRSIAQNMPSAYDLLPSRKYFETVSDPVISFNPEAPFLQSWRDFWGEFINSYSAFFSFVTGTGVSREEPPETVLRIPEVLRPELVTDADALHSMLDNYQIPGNIRVVQVAGWGSPTIKTIEYRAYHDLQTYDITPTIEGDKTVVYSSAVSSITDETYFFDIGEYRKSKNINTQHRDLLNANPIQALLMSVVEKENITETNFILATKPQVTDLNDQLIISTHSPVLLGVHDEFGNFTGINPNQDLSVELLSITEDIPGSTFLHTTESQYIFLPKEGVYNFVYKGIGDGPTTTRIDNFTNDTVVPIVSYTDIPTTSSTFATFVIDSSIPENTSISLDTDGDGEVDETILPDGTELSLSELIVLLKANVEELDIKNKLKKNILKKIKKLEKKIEKKIKKNTKDIEKFGKKISKEEMKGKIDTASADEILLLLELLEAQAGGVTLDASILAELNEKIQTLDIKKKLKKSLLRRVEKLERKNKLVKDLSRLSKDITKKAKKGKIADEDAQAIIDILDQIENVI